ncbi:MAG TPA: vanadium-dependent haloperoxidase [Chitinophagaceae bacterium]|nr:vanadium-dependent haloperoxidase [Chitinophagaceae bacterium]
MRKKIVAPCLITAFIILFSCSQKKTSTNISDAEILHQNQDLLTEVIIYDVFTPPVAARLYVYTSLASYEAIRFSKEGTASIAEQLHGFAKMPEPEKGKSYDYTLAASKAFFTVTRNIKVFSVDSLKAHEDFVYNTFKEKLDDATYQRSIVFGDSIAKVILGRAKNDGYFLSRGKPKHLGSKEAGKWRPSPPDYLDGVEWCWNTMKTMVLDSASQFMPPRPPLFSTDTNSFFYKNAKEVYTINRNLTEEQKTIARYWDDNPFVIEHSGHLMFATKKITPGGHWMGIAAIAAKQTKADPVQIAKGYAMTAIALYDAFIACWDEKYRSNVVRPVTYINENIDNKFVPFLQTPPFPEYTSGHSAITASASTVLAHIYGNNFSFQDTSDLRYIGMQRHFNSFQEAASEASVSRVYGGIHYRTGVEAGAAQGKKVGELIIERILKK